MPSITFGTHGILRHATLILRSLRTIVRLPHARAQLHLVRDADVLTRTNFLYAASTLGLLAYLRTWTWRDDLVERLGVRRPELLDSLLQVGVALNELARRGDLYRVRGSRATALASETGDSIAATLEELLTYHGPVYRDVGAHLAGAPPSDYLEGKGLLIARSSLILEPFMAPFVQDLTRGAGPLRLLEVGCGSGVYLRYAAQVNPEINGVGIALQPDVVRTTSASLREWGLDGRFRILHADIRTPGPELAGPFDLITLYGNIYYFPVANRSALLCSLRNRLSPGGRVAIISLFQAARSALAADFDLILRSTAGCAPLPRIDELITQLHEAGFSDIRTQRLMLNQPLFGIVAREL